MLAKRIAKDKRMHYNSATMLGWTFTAEQRQVLAYLFWEIFSDEASHYRKGRTQHRTVLVDNCFRIPSMRSTLPRGLV
jgi:hypothetical protein